MRYDKILKIRIDERLLKILRYNLLKRNNKTRRSISMSEYMRGGCGHFLGQAMRPIQGYVCTP